MPVQQSIATSLPNRLAGVWTFPDFADVLVLLTSLTVFLGLRGKDEPHKLT